MVASLYFELVSCTLFSNKHMAQDQGKLATASFPSNISMCFMLEKMLMLEGNVAFVQNIVHCTSSRYKLATTNHHGQGFCIGKLATISFFLA